MHPANDMKQILGVILGVTWLAHPANAHAQPAPERQDKVEVFADIAYARFSNGDTVWGRGLDYGGGIDFRPFSGNLHRVAFEVHMARLNKSEELSAALSHNLDSRLVTTNVAYHFGRKGAQTEPYAFGGLAYLTADYTSRCVDCVFDPDPVTGKLVSRGVTEERIEDGNVGVAFGAGLKIAVHRRLSIRPEVLLADTTAGAGWNWRWIRPQIGLGVHF